MSYRDTRMQKRVTVGLGILLSVAMGASLILPLLTQNLNTTVNVEPTATAQPTIVPPPDTSTITFDETYLHPSGLFTVAIPSGWEPSTNSNVGSEAQVTFRNPDAQSIIEVRVIEPDVEINETDDLNQIFTQDWLQSSWREYSAATEATRRVNDEDQLVIDFTLQRGASEFIARQLAFTDGTWVYAVRMVMPPNASQALQFILNNVAETLDPNLAFAGTPVSWEGYYDAEQQHLIRFPDAWTVTDAAPGLPASISGDDVTLRVEAADTVIDSEDAAETWVSENVTGANVTSVTAIEQNDYSGYRVAYTRPTLDGPSESGAVVLLNGPEDRLHVANLLLDESDVNLNSEDAATSYPEVLNVLASFSILPDLNLAASG